MIKANTVLARATEARDRVEPDELDSLGGLCSFRRPRQLSYAAAFSWGGTAEVNRAEQLALDALDAYAAAPAQERDSASVPITRSVLAVARVSQGQVDGAAEALAPVLDLPSSQRIHGIVASVERVRTALSAASDAALIAGTPDRDGPDERITRRRYRLNRNAGLDRQ